MIGARRAVQREKERERERERGREVERAFRALTVRLAPFPRSCTSKQGFSLYLPAQTGGAQWLTMPPFPHPSFPFPAYLVVGNASQRHLSFFPFVFRATAQLEVDGASPSLVYLFFSLAAQLEVDKASAADTRREVETEEAEAQRKVRFFVLLLPVFFFRFAQAAQGAFICVCLLPVPTSSLLFYSPI